MTAAQVPACPANSDALVRSGQAFAPKIILNDCTLREGE